ncbi:MAG TPA: hypothetical protein VF183_03795 [Acidimicrobiales bacterium]
MKVRIPVAALAVLALGLAACGDDGGLDQVNADSVSPVDEGSTSGDGDTSGVDEGSTSGDEDTGSDTGNTDDGGSDTDIPDLAEAGDCFQLALSYGAVVMAALGGGLGGQELSDAELEELRNGIEELRGAFPEEIRDDFEVVADAYNELFEKGLLSEDAMEVLESDEFVEADENIQQYLDEHCSG